MLTACATSALFLMSYLTYHYYVGSMPFRGQGWVGQYFTVLISHTALLATVLCHWSS